MQNDENQNVSENSLEFEKPDKDTWKMLDWLDDVSDDSDEL